MKYNTVQLAKQIIQDSKQYIDGNIAEYMIHDITVSENSLYTYLTEKEIDEAEQSYENRYDFQEKICGMLRENFNFDIKEFIY